jgi:hypothetical protein
MKPYSLYWILYDWFLSGEHVRFDGKTWVLYRNDGFVTIPLEPTSDLSKFLTRYAL